MNSRTISIAVVFTLLVGGLGVFLAGGLLSESGSPSPGKEKFQSEVHSEEHDKLSRVTRAAEAEIPWVPEKVEPVLRAGGLELPILFPEATKREVAEAISYDLNLVYGHLHASEIIDLYPPQTVVVGGKETEVHQMIKLTGQGRYFPKEHLGKFGFLDRESLLITDELASVYTRACARAARFRQEYEDLMRTLSQLNRLEEFPQVNAASWFYVDPQYKASGIEIPNFSSQQFIEAYKQYEYKQPSLLEVLAVEGSGELIEPSLIAKILVIDEKGKLNTGMMPLVFQEGRWRSFVTRPPT